MINKPNIFIFLDWHQSNVIALPYYEMKKRLNSGVYSSLATYDLEFLHFEYNSYLVVNNKILLYNQDVLNDEKGILFNVLFKEIRVTHNLPKLFRAGYLEGLMQYNFENNTYPNQLLEGIYFE